MNHSIDGVSMTSVVTGLKTACLQGKRRTHLFLRVPPQYDVKKAGRECALSSIVKTNIYILVIVHIYSLGFRYLY